MKKGRPDFEDIKTYEEFERYKWYRNELIAICKQHGLLFVGTEKKLKGVIEAYFNGVKIPPRRTWYTNIVLCSFVNENALLPFKFVIIAVSILLAGRGIFNWCRGMDDVSYVPHLALAGMGFIMSFVGIIVDKDLEVIRSYGPACGDQKFTRAQVDEQANAESTKYLSDINIFLAPDMLIGVSAGVAAVAYEDIASLQVKKTWHSNQRGYEGYHTYKLMVRTKKNKRVVMSNDRRNPGEAVMQIYDHCLQQNPQITMLEMKKSLLTTDEK